MVGCGGLGVLRAPIPPHPGLIPLKAENPLIAAFWKNVADRWTNVVA
jgi:hypothetical protein